MEEYYKVAFSAQKTYSYKITGGKMTLTEKFTSVKNMYDSECYFSFESGYAYISCTHAKICEKDDTYDGTLDTDKKTIVFESREDHSTYEATYTENFAAETVTIKFKDKEFICEFEGEKYTQAE
ncbi:MAG: hypothetical protein K2N58_08145 [Treponemataceae bacterium]|nr:hypothetical protein [Treponemataceae bacterium]